MITGLALSLWIVFLILIEAFFSGSEIAFLSCSRTKLFRKAREKDPRALKATELISKPESLFSTTVLGTTLAMTSSTTIATLFIIQKFGFDKEWITLLVLTPLILIFGEFVPKFISRALADPLVLTLAKPIQIASLIFYPLTKTLSIYAQILKRIIGENPQKGFFLSREELKAAVPASRGSDITPSERVLISRILDFGRITVKEMLRPLIDVVAIEQSSTLEEAVKLFHESGHSRLPVYQERIDRIVGVIQGFDCLRAPDLSLTVSEAMKPPLFVPESKPIDELMLELKAKPMAIVVNEYGGAEGILTLEDVMEEVVGEIEDEYDEPPSLYRQIGENSFIVNARMEIDSLRTLLKVPVPEDDDYQTLAGFLLKRMQKIPKKWDSTVIDGVEYVVQSATDRTIEEVYIVVHSNERQPAAKE